MPRDVLLFALGGREFFAKVNFFGLDRKSKFLSPTLVASSFSEPAAENLPASQNVRQNRAEERQDHRPSRQQGHE